MVFHIHWSDSRKERGTREKKNNSKALLTWYHQIACCSSAWIHYLPEKSEVRASVAESFYKKSIPNFYQNASWNTFLEYILLFCLLSENGFNDERVIELKPKEKKKGEGWQNHKQISSSLKKADSEFIIIISVEFFSKNYGVNHSSTVRHCLICVFNQD